MSVLWLVALAVAGGCDGSGAPAAEEGPPRAAEPAAHPAPDSPCGPAGQVWQDLAISPDGFLFAVQARSGAIALQRVRDGAHVRAMRTESDAPAQIEFVRGGARMIVRRLGRGGNTVGLWDVANARILRELNGGWIKAFAPSGEAYVDGSYDGRSPARLVRLSDATAIWAYPDSAQRVLFSADGSRIVVQLDLDRYAIWNVLSNEGIARVDRIRGTQMAITPDASLLGLLADGADPSLIVWRASDGHRSELDVSQAAALSLSTARLRGFSPDGQVLVVRSGMLPAGRAPWVAFWRVEDQGAPTVIDGMVDAAFLADGRLLMVDADGALSLRARVDAPPAWQVRCGG